MFSQASVCSVSPVPHEGPLSIVAGRAKRAISSCHARSELDALDLWEEGVPCQVRVHCPL